MKNHRIRNFDHGFSRFNRISQNLTPHQSSRHEIEMLETYNTGSVAFNSNNMLHNMKVKFLLTSMIKKLKYLSPPRIAPSNILQEWEIFSQQSAKKSQKKSQYVKQTLSEELSHRFQMFRHLNLLQGILIILFCWIVTVSIVFRQKIGFEIYITTLCVSLTRILLLVAFAIKQKDKQNVSFFIDISNDLHSSTLLLIACALFLVRIQLHLGIGDYIIELVGVLTIIFQYKQLEINFRNVVKYAEQNRMKKQLRILQLFMLIITLAHFFGCILYATTYLCPQGSKNWINQFDLDEQDWQIKYIYCLYWAITTIVTVGYGDLTPKNWVEVLFVMAVQIIGTAVFGYMINVIGITVNEIKKKSQEFENHQETIEKLRDHYQLSRELCHKMKHDIKQKQKQFKSIPLKTSEEKDFLEYIQPGLKQEFVLETNMRVIKKCIFFLTHFSVNFQNQVALKLIRTIYNPEEEIPIFDSQRFDGDRSMIIINSGCVGIFIQKNHNSIKMMKKLRQIKPSEDALVMNVFGYSSLVMNKNIKLKAITKEAAVSYILKRKDILQCIGKSMQDFESFNQMREKMSMYKILQEIEAPTLHDTEWHYIPNIFLIQKKITYKNQTRLAYYRTKFRLKTKVITAKNYQNKTIPKIDQDKSQIQKSQLDLHVEGFHSLKLVQANKIQDQSSQITFESLKSQQKLKIDQYKIFENFMKAFNLDLIAVNYEKSCHSKSYLKRTRVEGI